jgi:two-component system nitrogen regulation sensor histidine kinase NtrY
MIENLDADIPNSGPREARKRKRELVAMLLLGALFFLLTWFEFKLLDMSEQLPFVHSIFFFGLVNFNIVILLLLFFLIFRNIVKIFVEQQGKVIGSSLKGKLIAAFTAFAVVPTTLMFLVSVFYINNSFDKWFSVKMSGVLKNSLEVNQEYIFNAKKENYHFAKQIAQQVNPNTDSYHLELQLETLRDRFALDAVEYYPNLFGERIIATSKDESIPEIPPVSLEFLRKGLTQKDDASTIHHFGEGNLVRVIIPVSKTGNSGALVVSSYIPMSLIAKMDDISAAHEELRNLDPIQYPLKSIYLTVLVLMTLVILLCATWFGIYLARHLSVPLEMLGVASKRVAQGDYRPVEIVSGSKEMNRLIDHFNQMILSLDQSKKELTSTLHRLDEHGRYIEVVLSNVTTGVISVDNTGKITTMNRHAGQLLNIEPDKYVGRHLSSVLNDEYYKIFSGLIAKMREHKANSLQKEIRIEVAGQRIPLSLTLSILADDQGEEIGNVLVFDDLTPILNAQRAAAWTEVARRIAHEIKNPLTPIKLSAQRIERKFGNQIKDPAFNSSIQMIIQQTDDIKNLVNEFSNFARLPQTQLIPGQLNQVIEDALVLYRTAHAGTQFVFEKDNTLPDFKFDPDQIRRVLQNLVENGVAALSEKAGGRIVVRTQYDNLLKLVRISVSDNGAGIADSIRGQIFEPYFSTKQGGTGLGLAIVKRIVEDHNGFVRAFSNEPQGTKIIIELPITEGDSIRALPFEEENPNGQAIV